MLDDSAQVELNGDDVRILGGVLVGVLLSGAVMAVLVPTMPAARGPRVAWIVLGVCIAVGIFLARRTRKMPPR